MPERSTGIAAVALIAAFNVTWLVLFLTGGISAVRGNALGRLPVWLLAIASIANGLVHPALSLLQGGYFPGLWTSLCCLPAGLVLARALSDQP